MNTQKLTGMIGLALRARQAVTGMDACRIMIEAGRCGVLLMDGGAGVHTRKKCETLCSRTGTPMTILPDGFLEKATGHTGAVLAMQKGSFAEQVTTDCLHTDI